MRDLRGQGDEHGQLRARPERVQDGHDRDGVRGGQDGPEGQGELPVPSVGEHVLGDEGGREDRSDDPESDREDRMPPVCPPSQPPPGGRDSDEMVTKRADMSSFAAVPLYVRSSLLCARMRTGGG